MAGACSATCQASTAMAHLELAIFLLRTRSDHHSRHLIFFYFSAQTSLLFFLSVGLVFGLRFEKWVWLWLCGFGICFEIWEVGIIVVVSVCFGLVVGLGFVLVMYVYWVLSLCLNLWLWWWVLWLGCSVVVVVGGGWCIGLLDDGFGGWSDRNIFLRKGKRPKLERGEIDCFLILFCCEVNIILMS